MSDHDARRCRRRPPQRSAGLLRWLVAALAAGWAGPLAAAPSGRWLPSTVPLAPYAVTHATVHTFAPGVAALQDATIVVEGGVVRCLGRCVVPPGATVIDAAGGMVMPALVESAAHLGQVEVSAEKTSQDGDPGPIDNAADVRAIDGVTMRSRALQAARAGGVVATVARPLGAQLVTGQSVAFRTRGRTIDDALLRSPVAVHATLGNRGRRDGRRLVTSRSGQLALLRALLTEARRRYGRLGSKGSDPALRPWSLRDATTEAGLRALLPVAEGRLPLVVHAHRADDIAAALRLAGDLALRLVVVGGAEAWLVADKLAEARVPVIVSPVRATPDSFETARARDDNATLLHRAGVVVGIATGSTHGARNLRWEAGFAVAAGLPWDVAAAAISRTPAMIWGVDRKLGGLATGGRAAFVVFDGDPLSIRSHVRAVADGPWVEVDPKQR